jgi:putative MATE family efflux protein
MIKQLWKRNQNLDLTKGSTVKNIWVLAFPMMLGNVLQTAFNLVDMIWVGRLGSEAIASVAMSGAVLLVIITLIFGISTGTHSLVSRFTGAKNHLAAENVAMQSLIIGTILSIILAGIGITFSRSILQILGAKAAVLQMGTDYLKIILSGSLLMVYLFLINSIFRAAGDVIVPMLVMVGATILNIVLDPLMIFGIGFPRMGVRGAALATLFSQGLASLVGVFILFQGHSRIRIEISKFNIDLKTMFRIIKIGFPNSMQMALRSIVGLILMAIVARYGNSAIAAYGIGLRIFSVVLMPGFALATSAATLVGQNLGAKKFFRAKMCVWQAAGFNTLLMGVAGIFFFLFFTNLISIFNANPNIIRLGSEYLRITSFSYIFVAQGLVLGRSLMGAGDSISPMLIAFFSLLGVQIPLAIILPNHLNIGISGVWWAILVSSILQAILTIFWFNLGHWRMKKI